MNYSRIPGLLGVYKLQNGKFTKVEGEGINIDVEKLTNIVMENMRIGEEEAGKIGLSSLQGFAMILDDTGFAYINGVLVVVNAVKTNWDLVIKTLEGIMYEKS
ncbi:conserved hypothetical protein [Acidianus hospitalis W1]|uniref:Uncharacterized protein n=1 Tax=Acidianus hospitalis (strain W1) TaxID=933801 RepID=F4B5A9_ACIHW|nr:hypothetical protein [Acidianus hospitalis]AEE93203.1 conserved hypothetical protein [Acidianus hospitalis W1]